MSEHMSINGQVDYYHLPYDEEGAFTFCNHCGKTCDRINVELHQGWMSDWACVRCSKCKKSIWTSKLNRKQTKDDKKCAICGKPTNWIDCVTHGGRLGEKEYYWCSLKCNKEGNEEFFKEIEILDELNLCTEKQEIEVDFTQKLKIARTILKQKG